VVIVGSASLLLGERINLPTIASIPLILAGVSLRFFCAYSAKGLIGKSPSKPNIAPLMKMRF
jgi:hypothetical protein